MQAARSFLFRMGSAHSYFIPASLLQFSIYLVDALPKHRQSSSTSTWLALILYLSGFHLDSPPFLSPFPFSESGDFYPLLHTPPPILLSLPSFPSPPYFPPSPSLPLSSLLTGDGGGERSEQDRNRPYRNKRTLE